MLDLKIVIHLRIIDRFLLKYWVLKLDLLTVLDGLKQNSLFEAGADASKHRTSISLVARFLNRLRLFDADVMLEVLGLVFLIVPVVVPAGFIVNIVRKMSVFQISSLLYSLSILLKFCCALLASSSLLVRMTARR